MNSARPRRMQQVGRAVLSAPQTVWIHQRRSEDTAPYLARVIHPVACAAMMALLLSFTSHALAAEGKKLFRAGAYAININPPKFPVIVNAMFQERTATRVVDPLHARCLVLDDGNVQLAIAVVDTCMMPRDLLDQAKALAQQSTRIRPDHILISATHTHSAPSAMGCLGSRVDEEYAKFLPGRIAEGIERAAKNLAPARIGWAVVQDFEHTHNRRWIRRPDKIESDPFGERTVRANMHPGHQSPDAIGPSGPVDPDLSVLSIQSLEGRPIALVANYSMHYYDSPLLSSDYYGRFAEKIGKLLDPRQSDTPFVGIMSQGTSGDLMWMDYGQPRKEIGYDAYAEAMAKRAHEAYLKIEHCDWVPLVMREAKLTLRFRVPDEKRLAWSKEIVASLDGRLPRTLPEIYAREQIYLHDRPTAELKLQAIRVGGLGITAIPNEVFAITGLKIKAQSPLEPTFNIELANGAEGYIPPPEQHKLGGYTTWPARTAGLEVEAEPKIVETVLGLLEEVAGKPRRKIRETDDPYSAAILKSKPAAYWRFSEFNGLAAMNATGRGSRGNYEGGVAFFLEGPPFYTGQINRCAHFAGGRMKASLQDLGETYSVEMWFWNGLPAKTRAVTGCLFSRGLAGAAGISADQLLIGGTNSVAGRLVFSGGCERNEFLAGKTEVPLKTWNHVALVREGRRVRVYLNGQSEPEIAGDIESSRSRSATQVFIGGSNDDSSNLEGKLDEVAIYKRALRLNEITRHYQAARPPTRWRTDQQAGWRTAGFSPNHSQSER